MKVVINACFGGFSLSPKAIKRLAELNSKECYFFKTVYKGGLDSETKPITIEQAEKEFSWSAYSVLNPEEYAGSQNNWQKMSQEERKKCNEKWDEIALDNRDIERNDPKLVKVVEELGEEANGQCADLRIIDVPKGVKWHVEEYDGNEHIAEDHRTWG